MWLYAEIKTLGDIPRHYARATPEKAAVIDAAGPISFAELDVRSNRVANALSALEITPGGRVAFLGKNTARFFEILFGVNKIGSALLPLNWRLAAPELEEILADATPGVLIVDREFTGIAAQVLATSPFDCRLIAYDSSGIDSELDVLMRSAGPAGHGPVGTRAAPVRPSE